MSRAKSCVDKAIARGVPREKAESFRDHITRGDSAEWKARTEQLKEQAKRQAEAAEKRAGVNLARRVRAGEHISKAPDTVTGLQSLLIGSNTPFQGSRQSAEAAILGYKAEFLGTFRRDLGDAEKTFMSRKLEREWVRELYELNAKQGGQPGVTGSPEALKIATAVQKLQNNARDALNRNGAEIGQLDRYIARTEHSSERLERMGREGWKRLVMQTADLERTFGADRVAEYDELLGTMYERLRLGRFHDFDADEDRFVAPTQNVAKSVSQSRVLQFSTADGWYRYALEAGETPVTDRVLQSAMKAARNAGLMSVLGANPQDNFARIFARALEAETGYKAQQKLESAEQRLKGWLGIMTGDTGRIKDKGKALFVQNWLTLQRVAKLGMLPFSQIADLSTIMSELRYQGVDVPSRLLGPLAGYFRGKGSQQREVARLLGGAIDGWMSEVSAHMDLFDPMQQGGAVTGFLAKSQNIMFKYSGASAMTNRAREAGLYLMAAHWGQKRGVPFERLNAAERRIMEAFEIGPAEWTAFNHAQWTEVQGDMFLTPHAIESIPEARLNEWKAAIGRDKLSDEEARHILASRLWRYYSDRERYAVLDIGVRERSFITAGGTAPDTNLGIAMRLLWQFKSFAVAQVNRSWGRELYGGQGTLGAVSGLVQFAAMATVLGTVGEMLRQIAKGEDPLHSFREEPASYLGKGAIRGGAASIMGDFLLGEYSRHGQRPTGYITGPTGGALDDFATMFTRAKKGEGASASALNLARNNLPFQNFIWSKAAFDAFIWAELMDYVQPGYSSRIARRQRQNGVKPLIGN